MFDYGSAEVLGRSVGDLPPEIDMAGVCLPGGQPYLGKLETPGLAGRSGRQNTERIYPR